MLLINSFYFVTSKKDDKPKNQLKKLPIAADSTNLGYEDYAYLTGWAESHISWSFSTSPSKNIQVWAIESYYYAHLVLGGTSFGYLLSEQSSGTGTFNVPQVGKWYVLFWNKQAGDSTTVTYSGSFYGDTRTPNITIIEPTSSSTYQKGKFYDVKWTIAINSGSYVKIDLFKGNSLDSTLLTSTPNNGVASIQIPPSSSEGFNYRIKITSTSKAFYDYSEYFTIENQTAQTYLTIISPAKGEVYEHGDKMAITWETNCPSTTVSIKISSSCGNLYYIATVASDAGTYNWTIPNSINVCNYYWITVTPNACTIPLEPVSYFSIIASSTSNPAIPSYNISIIIWTIIWVIIPIIIFAKKKNNL